MYFLKSHNAPLVATGSFASFLTDLARNIYLKTKLSDANVPGKLIVCPISSLDITSNDKSLLLRIPADVTS